MRNGAVVGSFDDPNFDHNELISTMIGRSINLAFPPRIAPLATDAPVVLKARSISVGSRVRNVDLDIRNGEIVGVAALEGQGQRELFYGLAGAISLTEGNAEISGTPINLQSPQTAMQSGKGIVLVPEERKREGLFTDQSTARNITSVALKKISALGVIRRPAEAKLAAQYGATANLPTKYLNREVGQLSGGNQQKSILARISLTGAQVLLMFDPTRGIDPSAKLEVYGTLRKAADEGAAILFYSTEIPELVGLCDRVIVLYAGRVAGEFSGDQLKESSLMAAAVGHSGAGRANAEESA
jgi:ribose transport system ATP-binding protein